METILRGRSVLVVDDTAVNRMVAADILNSAGARVLEAHSGESALEVAAASQVDAFLLDVRMGAMNGIELCRLLRASAAHRNTPIVFVTAMDQREVLQWALEAGADDFIQKPLHAMVLRRRLANLLHKSLLLREAQALGDALKRYVSPRAGEVAMAYAATQTLPPPARREVCVLFSDARGFTEMSQDLAPETVFEILSVQLAAQADLVYRHGGYVDKYAGDGLMAVFDGEAMAARACRCALEILARDSDAGGEPAPARIRVGIGIHQGSAMIGHLGAAGHLDYTAVGRTVNLAARLCGLADQSAVVTQAVRDAAGREPGLAFRAERAATIRGIRESITVYDLAAGNAIE